MDLLHSKEQGDYKPIDLYQGRPKPNDNWPYHNHPTTPHDREFARLVGCYPDMLKDRRDELASKFATRHKVTVVLKGSKTIVASPDGNMLYNEELGNPGMAVGGAGDVLAGIIASLTAQSGDVLNSAAAGVYVHALAGDIAAGKYGQVSMLPTDIIEALPEAFKRILG